MSPARLAAYAATRRQPAQIPQFPQERQPEFFAQPLRLDRGGLHGRNERGDASQVGPSSSQRNAARRPPGTIAP
jgi:hypothetical protein